MLFAWPSHRINPATSAVLGVYLTSLTLHVETTGQDRPLLVGLPLESKGDSHVRKH